MSVWGERSFGSGALSWSPVGLEWQADALSRQVSADLFHSEHQGEREVVAMAKRVCNGDGTTDPCPVREKCLEWALESGDSWAVLGGMSPRQRARLRADRRRRGVTNASCRICGTPFLAGTTQQQDCSQACRDVSRRRSQRNYQNRSRS